MLASTQSDREIIGLANTDLDVVLSMRGGAVVEARTADMRPFLRGGEGDGPIDAAVCFPMVPVCNRVECNRFGLAGVVHEVEPNTADPFHIHGDGWLADWRLEAVTADTARLSYRHLPSAASPFDYLAEQVFRLNGPVLSFRLSVTNTGDLTLPFGLGFHPYFPRTPLTTLSAPATGWWTERAGHLPGALRPVPEACDFSTARRLPEGWINNCFEGWNGAARIAWPETSLAADLQAGAPLDRYMIYAPHADAGFFCFEPMSHTPNALSHVETDAMGMRLLAPGEEMIADFSIRVFEWSASDG